jgi:hypothetical protein
VEDLDVLVAYAPTGTTTDIFGGDDVPLNAREYKVAGRNSSESSSSKSSVELLYSRWEQEILEKYGNRIGSKRRNSDGSLLTTPASQGVQNPPKFVVLLNGKDTLTTVGSSNTLEAYRAIYSRTTSEMQVSNPDGFEIFELAIAANKTVYFVSIGLNNNLVYVSLPENTIASSPAKVKSSTTTRQVTEPFITTTPKTKSPIVSTPKLAESGLEVYRYALGGYITDLTGKPLLIANQGLVVSLIQPFKDLITADQTLSNVNLTDDEQIRDYQYKITLSASTLEESKGPFTVFAIAKGNSDTYFLTYGGANVYAFAISSNVSKTAKGLGANDALNKLKNGAVDKVTPAPTLNETYETGSAFYRIIYKDESNNYKSFVFTFAPARETKGGWNVPEVKTGIPVQTTMRHKMQVVPGAGPLVQTIGVAGTKLTVVGALVGNESSNEAFKTGAANSPLFYEVGKDYKIQTTATSELNGAIDVSKIIDRDLVQSGRLVTLECKPASNFSSFLYDANARAAGNFIRYTGVITAVRFQFVHVDRAYYALDMFVTDYPLSVTKSTVVASKLPTNTENAVESSTLAGADADKKVSSVASGVGIDYSNPVQTNNSNNVSASARLAVERLKTTVATYSPPSANYLKTSQVKADILDLAATGNFETAVTKTLGSTLSNSQQKETLRAIAAIEAANPLVQLALQRLA